MRKNILHMKKILFITAFLPNLGAAAEKNTMYMLDKLSEICQVDLIYFKYDNQPQYISKTEKIQVLKCYRINLYQKLLNIFLSPYLYPLFTVRYNRCIMNYIASIIKNNNYSAIVFDHSQVFLFAKKLSNNDIPKLMLSHDVIAQRVGRTHNKFITTFCKFSENYCLNSHNAILFALCDKDINLIKTLYKKKANLSQLYIDKLILDTYPSNISNDFIFMGKWSRADNIDGVIWFFKNVVPHLKKKIEIKIIGKDFPYDKIEKYIIQSKINVSLLGFVDNPYPLISNCKALLAPLFSGAGIKVKVLEALGCGAPVIGTEIAFEGIDKSFNKLMFSAQNENEFASLIETIDVDIKTRYTIKESFIKSFKDETIPSYINKHFL